MALLTPSDIAHITPALTDEARQIVLDDALALASMVAPCITSPDLPELQRQQAKAIIRKAIAYDQQASGPQEAGQSIGPASVQYHRATPSSVLFTPDQEAALSQICTRKAVAPGTMYSLQLTTPSMQPQPHPRYGRW